MSLNTCRKYKV